MILACDCGKKFKIPPEKAATLKPGSHFKCTACGKQIPIPASDPALEPAVATKESHSSADTGAQLSTEKAAPPPPARQEPPPAAEDPLLKARVSDLQELLDTERKMFSEELDQLKEEVTLLQARLEEQEKAAAEAPKPTEGASPAANESLAEEVGSLKAALEEGKAAHASLEERLAGETREREAIAKDLRDAEAAVETGRKRAEDVEARLAVIERERDEARKRIAEMDAELAKRAAQEEPGRAPAQAIALLEETSRHVAELSSRMGDLSAPLAALREGIDKALATARGANGTPTAPAEVTPAPVPAPPAAEPAGAGLA